MFHSARIKLTGWYLLIIMLVSVSFSVVIYAGMAGELKRGYHQAELRLRAEELGIVLPGRFPDRFENLPPRLREVSPSFLFTEDLEFAKKRIIFNLLILNGVILGVSALSGYFLAGKTLRPIAMVMEEQKRFVADASHELRTPLTALKTSMEVALREKKSSAAKFKKIIKSNLEDIDSLQSLADKLLSLANLQDNGQKLVFETVDIGKVIKNASRKISPLANKKNIDIKIKVRKQIVWGNKESLQEMVVIFLDNAVKYTPKGGIISITAGVDKKEAILEIKDNGIGIAKEDILHVFDRFYRADQSRSNKVSGFGLGLSVAKKIIDLHRGFVEVKSKVGKGTTFTIKFPLKYS